VDRNVRQGTHFTSHRPVSCLCEHKVKYLSAWSRKASLAIPMLLDKNWPLIYKTRFFSQLGQDFFFIFHRLQIGSGTHPATYLMDTGDKAVGASS